MIQNDWLAVGLHTAGGIYGNEIEAGARGEGPTDVAAIREVNETAFVGEINLNTALRLTDWLSLTAGPRVLWLDGVASASDQILPANFTSELVGTDRVSSLRVDTGTEFFYGGTFGAVIRF